MAGAENKNEFVLKQKKFVRELFFEKRYFDAIAEMNRLIAIDPGSDNRDDYHFFIGVNYFLGGQYKSAVGIVSARLNALEYRNGILLSQSYLKLGMSTHGLEAALNIRYGSVNPSLRYLLLARRAEAYLECGLYRELLDEINYAEQFVPEREKLDLLREEVARYRGLPFKSVPLAVALSAFIPGAGQMYAGKYVLGVVSFIGVAAMAGGAYYFYRHNQTDLFYTFVFFSSVFYVGNIYGAYNASRTMNEDMGRSFRETVRKKCIPVYDPAREVKNNRIFQ
jgi:TM2 domain-containing membrane protein YozV